MVTLGGGSGWGVLLDDRQMPTSAAQGRGGTSRRGEHPIKPSRAAGKKRRTNTRNTLARNTRNNVDWDINHRAVPTNPRTDKEHNKSGR